MNSSRLATFTIVFSIAYAAVYLLAVENNWALFTYHPALETFGALVQKPIDGGPAMYWYGWLATSGLGAFAIAVLAGAIPAGFGNRIWSSLAWAVPLATMFAFGYILRGYFTK